MDMNAAIMDIVTVLTETPRMEKDAALARLAELRREGAKIQAGKTKTPEEHARDILKEIGMPVGNLGYRYAAAMVDWVVRTGARRENITKIYEAVAERFQTTTSKVERGIRHATENAWDRGDTAVLNKYFGNTVDPYRGKPMNRELAYTLAEEVERRMRR